MNGISENAKLKYAGIGSRETPPDIIDMMAEFAYSQANELILRSGGAPGADDAFEVGATAAGGEIEIFWPWPNYKPDGHPPLLDTPIPEAFELAERFHPAWDRLKQGARKLHARNSHIILGADLSDPVDFVVCWTTDGGPSGGTGQALRIAEEWEIPVYNVFRFEYWVEISDLLDKA